MAIESIARRTNSMANHRDAEAMRKILAAALLDIQNQLAYSQVPLTASATYAPPSLNTLLTAKTTIAVPGAVVGDFVVAAFGITMGGVTLTGYVSSPGVVTCVFDNGTSGTVALASSTLRVVVFPKMSDTAMSGLLAANVSYNPASLLNQTQALATVNVRGAALGDFVLASFSLDLQGFTMSAYVSATDTVKVIFQNNTGATIDLAAGTLSVRVAQDASFSRATALAGPTGVLSGTATYDAGNLITLTGETSNITVTGAIVGDFVLIGHGIDQAGIYITGYVSAADTVTVRTQNGTSGTLNLASATITARTIPQAGFPASVVLNTTA